jgi:hypothetical protein
VTKISKIYQEKNGAVELKADVSADTIWVSKKQIAQIFEVMELIC